MEHLVELLAIPLISVGNVIMWKLNPDSQRVPRQATIKCRKDDVN